jgi:hypothetical protein
MSQSIIIPLIMFRYSDLLGFRYVVEVSSIQVSVTLMLPVLS